MDEQSLADWETTDNQQSLDLNHLHSAKTNHCCIVRSKDDKTWSFRKFLVVISFPTVQFLALSSIAGGHKFKLHQFHSMVYQEKHQRKECESLSWKANRGEK